MGITNFLLVLVALSLFYIERLTGSGSFLGMVYYALPLLLINSGFTGYTAYATFRRV
jgi:hypothetical protein